MQGGTGMKLLFNAYNRSLYPRPFNTLPARVDEFPRVKEPPLRSEFFGLRICVPLPLPCFCPPY